MKPTTSESDSHGSRCHLAPEVVQRHESATDVRDMMQACCEAKAMVTLCGAQIPKPIQARFDAVHGDRLDLTIDGSLAASIGMRSLCTAIFTFRNRQCMFFSVALQRTPPLGATVERLCIRMPHTIDEIEARWNKRLKIGADALVLADTLWNGETIDALVVDIGRGGADLDFIGELPEAMQIGDIVKLHLQFGSQSVEVDAELRWRQENRAGFCFSHFQGRPAVNVPVELEAFIQAIERQMATEAA